MNYIVNIENADQELLEKVIRTLDSQGFKKVGYKAIYTALRVFTNAKGKNRYSCGSYIGYLAYRNAGMKDYADAKDISLSTLYMVLTDDLEEFVCREHHTSFHSGNNL